MMSIRVSWLIHHFLNCTDNGTNSCAGQCMVGGMIQPNVPQRSRESFVTYFRGVEPASQSKGGSVLRGPEGGGMRKNWAHNTK